MQILTDVDAGDVPGSISASRYLLPNRGELGDRQSAAGGIGDGQREHRRVLPTARTTADRSGARTGLTLREHDERPHDDRLAGARPAGEIDGLGGDVDARHGADLGEIPAA